MFLDDSGDTDRGDDVNEMGDYLPAVNLGAFTPYTIATGSAHVCVISTENSVKCFGKNS